MHRKIKSVLGVFVSALCGTLLLQGALYQIDSGTWKSTPNITEAREGASAVLLSDGRILIAGGGGADGPLATAEMFGTDGSFSPAAPMNVARSQHISVVLQDGRVLVAGGTVLGGGATNALEIYDPDSDSWSNVAGGMLDARSGLSATLLRDGRVLLAGGENAGVASSTLEVFDPSSSSFSFAGQLSSPRTQHAAAQLKDGRVLIIGGLNGSHALASVDIYDPVNKKVSAGASLLSLRAGLSATVLLDGQILVAGGNDGSNDLASAEVYNTASARWIKTGKLSTPRSKHLASGCRTTIACWLLGERPPTPLFRQLDSISLGRAASSLLDRWPKRGPEPWVTRF